MSTEHETKVEVRGGKFRTILQVSTLAVLSFSVGIFTMWSDRHNDERYVSKEEYKKDRANDEKMNAQIMATINWRMDQADKKLDEISSDIKTLTRRYSAQ